MVKYPRLLKPTLKERCLSYFVTYPNREATVTDVHNFVLHARFPKEPKPTSNGTRAALQTLVKEGKLKRRTSMEGNVFYRACEKIIKTDPIFYVEKRVKYSEYFPTIRRRIERILISSRHTPPTKMEIARKLDEGRKPDEDPFKESSISLWLVKLVNEEEEAVLIRDDTSNKVRYAPTKKLLGMEALVFNDDGDPKESLIMEETEEQIEEVPSSKTPQVFTLTKTHIINELQQLKQRLLEEALKVEALEMLAAKL